MRGTTVACSTRRGGEVADRLCHRTDPGLVASACDVAIDLAREPIQRCGACGTVLRLGRIERLGDRGGASGGEAVAANELVEIGANNRERGRPGQVWLALRIELLQHHQLCGRDL